MALYIRDDNVRELAAKLAEAERRTITEVVRAALEERLAQRTQEHEERWRTLHEIQERIAKLPELRPGFTDKDLYDDNGLPIL